MRDAKERKTKVKGPKKLKGKTSKFKSKGSYAKHEKPVNMEVYNRADDAMEKMIGNKGVPRQKFGYK